MTVGAQLDSSAAVLPFDGTFLVVWTDLSVNSGDVKGQVYEYACHEGNYGLTGILAGGRLADREKAAAGK